jgi:hypothetical protein
MMNPIKRKLARSLTEAAEKGMEAMDPDSPCARSLQASESDAHAVLAEAIERICDEISILEAAKLVRLAALLKSSKAADVDKYKTEIRTLALRVVERVERNTGSLEVPPACRALLLNL